MSKARLETVSDYEAGQRIDNFLASRLKGVPKGRIYKAIRKGEVRVDGGRVKQTHRLVVGQQVRIPPIQLSEKQVLMPPSERWVKAFQERVLLQNDHLILFNKPAGMPVHAGTGIERGLIENLKAAPGFSPEWELVHRLDRETSGLLVIAKRGTLLRRLHDSFRERTIQKGYLLWVAGEWFGGERLVDKPLLRTEGGNGERMVQVDAAGQQAKTRFRPLVVQPKRSLLWAMPETGRTHQIRVHAAAIGHPVIGDQKYGNSISNQIAGDSFSDRLFLHSASLCFSGNLSNYNCCAVPDPIWYEFRFLD